MGYTECVRHLYLVGLTVFICGCNAFNSVIDPKGALIREAEEQYQRDIQKCEGIKELPSVKSVLAMTDEVARETTIRETWSESSATRILDGLKDLKARWAEIERDQREGIRLLTDNEWYAPGKKDMTQMQATMRMNRYNHIHSTLEFYMGDTLPPDPKKRCLKFANDQRRSKVSAALEAGIPTISVINLGH